MNSIEPDDGHIDGRVDESTNKRHRKPWAWWQEEQARALKTALGCTTEEVPMKRKVARVINTNETTERITVQKGVPIPEKTRKSIYPWSQMEDAGDYFFVPGKTIREAGAFYSGAKKRDMSVTVRPMTRKDGVTGLGVWRK